MHLILHRVGPDVVGVVEINPQEHSLGDVLQSLTKKDRIRHDVGFTAAELASATGSEAPPAVVARLRQLLQPYLH